jgi:hypothetical protein
MNQANEPGSDYSIRPYLTSLGLNCDLLSVNSPRPLLFTGRPASFMFVPRFKLQCYHLWDQIKRKWRFTPFNVALEVS